MNNNGPFNTSVRNIRTGAPRVTAFIESAIRELAAPQSLQQRNFAQLMLAERVAAQYDLSMLAAVEAISPLYRAKFPN